MRDPNRYEGLKRRLEVIANQLDKRVSDSWWKRFGGYLGFGIGAVSLGSGGVAMVRAGGVALGPLALAAFGAAAAFSAIVVVGRTNLNDRVSAQRNLRPAIDVARRIEEQCFEATLLDELNPLERLIVDAELTIGASRSATGGDLQHRFAIAYSRLRGVLIRADYEKFDRYHAWAQHISGGIASLWNVIRAVASLETFKSPAEILDAGKSLTDQLARLDDGVDRSTRRAVVLKACERMVDAVSPTSIDEALVTAMERQADEGDFVLAL